MPRVCPGVFARAVPGIIERVAERDYGVLHERPEGHSVKLGRAGPHSGAESMSGWATLRALVSQPLVWRRESDFVDARAYQRWLVIWRWSAEGAALVDGPEGAAYWAVTATIGARRPNHSADVGLALGIGMPPEVW